MTRTTKEQRDALRDPKRLAETLFRNVSEDGWSSEMVEEFISEFHHVSDPILALLDDFDKAAEKGEDDSTEASVSEPRLGAPTPGKDASRTSPQARHADNRVEAATVQSQQPALRTEVALGSVEAATWNRRALLDEIEGAEKGDVAIDPTAADKAWAVFLYPADISWGARQARITFEEALLTYVRTAGECSGGADRVPVAADANATPAPLYAAPVPAKVTEEMVDTVSRAIYAAHPHNNNHDSVNPGYDGMSPDWIEVHRKMASAAIAALSHKGGGIEV